MPARTKERFYKKKLEHDPTLLFHSPVTLIASPQLFRPSLERKVVTTLGQKIGKVLKALPMEGQI
jgi:hypothetical protein